MSVACGALADGAEPVRATVRFPAPVSHYAEVEEVFPVAAGQKTLELFLPVWTPGSYLVREYARNLETVRATGTGGGELAIEKTRKNRWRIMVGASAGVSTVTVRYRVYCREMSVRTNWVDENFGLLNGAATFLAQVGDLKRAFEVCLELPAGWKMAISGLPNAGTDAGANAFRARDYDTLVDSPILAGSPAVHEFEVAGKKHYLVNQGETGLWDGARAAKDTRTIVERNLAMWGSLPYEKYVFLNLIVDAGGGLEHKNSMTIMSGRYATRTRKGYLNWLGLVSHEYFHAWNVKRLRPKGLGPFDYENENYTHSLWLAEGFTEYYAGLNLRRAGLATDAEYLGQGAPMDLWRSSLSAMLEAIQTAPGRLTQPLEMASYDAWIKAYRPDENSGNTSVDYYGKGALTGWQLDAKIRQATDGKKSLDDLMRTAFAQYSGERGYTTADIADLAGETAGIDLKQWFQKALQTTEEMDFSEALSWFGLEFKKADPPKSDNRTKAWTGAQTRAENGRLQVTRIPRDTPAEKAGLSADDEILAVDDWRVTPEGWAGRLEQYAPGDTVQMLVSRRDRVITVPVTLGEEPARKWQLQVRADASSQQKRHFSEWTGSAPPAK